MAAAFLGGGVGVGIGVSNAVASLAGTAGSVSARDVAGVFTVLIILLPVMALAIRLSIPAVIRAFRENMRPDVIDRIDERLALVADEVTDLATKQERLAETVAFDRRLYAKDPEDDDHLPSERDLPL